MPEATSDIQLDTPEVRVTQWRLPPGSETGPHTHEMDYVVVPMTDSVMTIVAADGTIAKSKIATGKSYFRKTGIRHNVRNETASEILFVEIELKPRR